jgi:hypothetical protein
VIQNSKCGIIALCNSYCGNHCNSYYHYKFMSEENKRSLLTLDTINTLARSFTFNLPRIFECPAYTNILCKMDVIKLAAMQLNAGIVNFKLGRGNDASSLNQLVALIAQA